MNKLFLLFLVFIIGCTSQQLCFDDICITYEEAITFEEQAKGLMGETLEAKEGMLFLYDSPSIKKFWMKNMIISLDILWFDENNTILHIDKDVPPCIGECVTYGPGFATYNVLEVNAGFTEKYNIQIGNSFTIS